MAQKRIAVNVHICTLTAIEMPAHRVPYDISDACYVGTLAENEVFIDMYNNLLNAVLVPRRPAEMMHLYAISAATGEVIESYMPSVAQLLHNLCSRRVIGPAAILMWSVASFTEMSDFGPNHFALLQTCPHDVITVSNECPGVTNDDGNSNVHANQNVASVPVTEDTDDVQDASDSVSGDIKSAVEQVKNNDNIADNQHASDNDASGVNDDNTAATDQVNVDVNNTSTSSESTGTYY